MSLGRPGPTAFTRGRIIIRHALCALRGGTVPGLMMPWRAQSDTPLPHALTLGWERNFPKRDRCSVLGTEKAGAGRVKRVIPSDRGGTRFFGSLQGKRAAQVCYSEICRLAKVCMGGTPRLLWSGRPRPPTSCLPSSRPCSS